MRHIFTVTASHSHPDFAAKDKPVLVSQDRIDGSWSATASRLGSGKSAATPEAAIRSLFRDNACTDVTITGPIKSGEWLSLQDAPPSGRG